MISRFFDFSSKPGSCPESPDSRIIPARQKIFSRKGGGGVLATASRDARVVDPEVCVSRNRLLSALISDVARSLQLSRNSFGIVVIFPVPSQPGLCPDQPVSPIITSGQEMVFGK